MQQGLGQLWVGSRGGLPGLLAATHSGGLKGGPSMFLGEADLPAPCPGHLGQGVLSSFSLLASQGQASVTGVRVPSWHWL